MLWSTIYRHPIFFCAILLHLLLIRSCLSLTRFAIMDMTASMVLSTGTSVSNVLIKTEVIKNIKLRQSLSASDSSVPSIYNVKDIIYQKIAKSLHNLLSKIEVTF